MQLVSHLVRRRRSDKALSGDKETVWMWFAAFHVRVIGTADHVIKQREQLFMTGNFETKFTLTRPGRQRHRDVVLMKMPHQPLNTSNSQSHRQYRTLSATHFHPPVIQNYNY